MAWKHQIAFTHEIHLVTCIMCLINIHSWVNLKALVHLLRIEGIQLGDSPVPPEDTIKLRPKRYEEQQVNVEEQPEWVTYR